MSDTEAWIYERLKEWRPIRLQNDRGHEAPDLVREMENDGNRKPNQTLRFVGTPFQRKIFDALDGRALKKQALANEVCSREGTRLYRKGGIKEMIEVGLVAHQNGVGYYRPDAPPLGLVLELKPH
jgi:hypothetical protein